MGNPTTDGRMIRKKIADSSSFASLSPEAAVLFCMIIPHLSSHGKLQGGPAFIKEIVCPKVSYLTIENIPIFMDEISKNTDTKWFKNDSRFWIHSLHFSEHQKLKNVGKDTFPDYQESSSPVDNLSPNQVPTKSELKNNKSELSPLEVEAEVEVEVEAEGKFALKQQPVDSFEKDKNALLEEENIGESDNGKKELRYLVSQIQTTYPKLPIITFLQSHSRDHPEAIIHALRSLLKHKIEIPEVPILMKYLEVTIKSENQNYNARESERRCNEFKKPINFGDISALISGIGKPIPAATAEGR